MEAVTLCWQPGAKACTALARWLKLVLLHPAGLSCSIVNDARVNPVGRDEAVLTWTHMVSAGSSVDKQVCTIRSCSVASSFDFDLVASTVKLNGCFGCVPSRTGDCLTRSGAGTQLIKGHFLLSRLAPPERSRKKSLGFEPEGHHHEGKAGSRVTKLDAPARRTMDWGLTRHPRRCSQPFFADTVIAAHQMLSSQLWNRHAAKMACLWTWAWIQQIATACIAHFLGQWELFGPSADCCGSAALF